MRPDASIGSFDSLLSRQRPMASKFSSAKPSGSIIVWQVAQTGFVRCCTMRSRIESTLPSALRSRRSGTFGGGGGGGAPRMFSRIHFPRITGDVRFGYAVTVRMLPCPSSPPRGSSSDNAPGGSGCRRCSESRSGARAAR